MNSTPDELVAATRELALAALHEITPASTIGPYADHRVEADGVVSLRFQNRLPGYPGWFWTVTVAQVDDAEPTVLEAELMPGDGALLAPDWVPWADRIEPGDVAPGILMPTADDDPRLEPGYTAGEYAADLEPAEASAMRAVVAELGLGRERVLSAFGRDEAAERWLDSDGGPDNDMTRQAPGQCSTCGYFVRLTGSMGVLFGACANQYSPSDAHVVSIDHGCGGHSDVAAPERTAELPTPIWDTINVEESLFD